MATTEAEPTVDVQSGEPNDAGYRPFQLGEFFDHLDPGASGREQPQQPVQHVLRVRGAPGEPGAPVMTLSS